MHNIYVVDDCDKITKSIANIISSIDNTLVRTFNDAFYAFNEALSCKPDLMLLDYMMPQMDGLTMIRELHKENVNPAIIIITGLPEAVKSNILPSNGVKKTFIKPFSMFELKNAVEEILSNKSHRVVA